MDDKPFKIFASILTFVILVIVFLEIKRSRSNNFVDEYDGFRGGGRRGGGGRGWRGYGRRPIVYGNPYIYPSTILTLENPDQDEKDLEIERLKKELKNVTKV